MREGVVVGAPAGAVVAVVVVVVVGVVVDGVGWAGVVATVGAGTFEAEGIVFVLPCCGVCSCITRRSISTLVDSGVSLRRMMSCICAVDVGN